MSKWARGLKDERGGVAVEAALMFPIVLMLLLMATDMMNYFITLRKLSASAATAADLLASAGEMVDREQLAAIANAAAPSGVASAMQAGTGITFQSYEIVGDYQTARWQFISENGEYCGPPAIDVSNLMTDDADVLVVGACGYWRPHTFSVLGLQPRNIVQHSIVRPKTSLITLCTDCE
jgi:uncharacterized membrane protein